MQNDRSQPYFHLLTFNPSTIHSFIHSLIHSCIHSFIHSFTYSFIHSFIHLFIHSFILRSRGTSICVNSAFFSLNSSFFHLLLCACETGISYFFVFNWEKKADMCTWLIKSVQMNLFDEWTFLMIAWKWMKVNKGEWRWMKVSEGGKVTRRKIDAKIGSFARFWHLRNRLTDQLTNQLRDRHYFLYTHKDKVKQSLAYNPLCPLVGWLVGWSVGRLVSQSVGWSVRR